MSIQRRDGTDATKRTLTIRDNSNRSIEVTLWGEKVENPGKHIFETVRDGARPLLLLKGAHLYGCIMQCVFHSSFAACCLHVCFCPTMCILPYHVHLVMYLYWKMVHAIMILLATLAHPSGVAARLRDAL